MALTLGALALGLTACSPVHLLNAATPSGSYDLTKNAAYGDLDRQVLDAYSAKAAEPDAPVLVFIHGGSWSSGNKNIYKFVGQSFAAAGYNIVIPNYRLYPDVIFPAFIEDAAKAVAWTVDYFPDRPVIIMGHSAGAHSAVSLALNPDFLNAVGVDRCDTVSGIIGLAGPYGESPFKSEPYITMFPDRHEGKDAPLKLVENPAPPFLLLTGTDDTTVNPDNSSLLAEAITARGGIAASKFYPGVEHAEILKFMSRYFDEDEALLADMLGFIGSKPEGPATTGKYCH